jgi:hypothetical protein
MEPESRPKTAHTDDRPAEGPRSFGLIHLAACIGIGGAAVLAVNLLERLM